MAGDHQRRDLVDDLPVRHPFAAVLVAGVEQHRHVVRAVAGRRAAGGAALRDEPADQRRQLAELEREAQVARRLLGEHRERVLAGIPHHQVEVVAEDRAQDDPERHLAHVVGDVDRLAALALVLPGRQQPVVRACDDPVELREDAAVKRRLHHAALALPELTLAHYDAVAQQDLDAVEPDAFRVVAVIRDQDAAHVVRMVEHPGVGSSAGRVDAVGVAEPGVDLAHAVEGVRGRADVEALVRFRRERGDFGHGTGNFT